MASAGGVPAAAAGRRLRALFGAGYSGLAVAGEEVLVVAEFDEAVEGGEDLGRDVLGGGPAAAAIYPQTL